MSPFINIRYIFTSILIQIKYLFIYLFNVVMSIASNNIEYVTILCIVFTCILIILFLRQN